MKPARLGHERMAMLKRIVRMVRGMNPEAARDIIIIIILCIDMYRIFYYLSFVVILRLIQRKSRMEWTMTKHKWWQECTLRIHVYM